MSAFQPTSESLAMVAVEAGLIHHEHGRLSLQTSGKPKKKRLNHNELERKRRHHQREILYELRDVIPTLHMVKPSTVLIMQKAKDYIDLLRRTIQEMELEVNDLRRALVAAGYPLPMAPHQQVMCGFPSSASIFNNSSCQSPRILSEQMLNMSPQSQLQIEQNQLAFQGLSDIALVNRNAASFDPHDLESMNQQLHSVLSKSAAINSAATTVVSNVDIPGNVSGRPISPVSPYQLDQVQGCDPLGEFKNTSHAALAAASGASTSAQTILGTHA